MAINFINKGKIKGQEKIITPSTSEQIIVPDEGYNALNSVTINAVNSEIDTNIKSTNIKKGISILGTEGNVIPAEPIYGSNNIKIINTKKNTGTDTGFDVISYIGKYFSYTKTANSSRNMIKGLYSIEDDGSVKTIYKFETGVGNYTVIIDVIDNYIYIHFPLSGYRSIIDIYRINISNPLNYELYWTINLRELSGDTNVNEDGLDLRIIDKSTFMFGKYLIKIDLLNKKLLKCINSTFTIYCALTKDIFLDGNRTKMFSINTSTTSNKLTDKINFVNNTGNKIITNNNLYYLNSNLSVGELIKSNIFSNYKNSDMLINIRGNYYARLAQENSELLLFNEEANTFTSKMNLRGAALAGYRSQGHQVKFLDNSGTYYQYLLPSEDTNEIIGYNVENDILYKEVNRGLTSEDILNGVQVYNEDRVPIVGTMPNNGELNITPSTQQQTIPEGYTSGGTVRAVDNTIDSNIQASNIKKDVSILGITGSLQEGIDTSDADATANDIAIGKTAYVNGEKVTGILPLFPNSRTFTVDGGVTNDTENSRIQIHTINTTKQTLDSNLNMEFNGEYADVADAIGLTADKIKAGETILGIIGTYTGETT